MASAHLLSSFVLSTLMFIFISPSHSILEGGDVHVAKVPSPVHPRKVDLALYYEALCPSCADFIINDLPKVFLTDLKTIVNLTLVPWGNAKVINGTIVCQHGENECYLNTIQACAIKAWPEVIKHYSFIGCIEAEIFAKQVRHSQDVETAWRKCAANQGLPQEPIDNCYYSGEGTKLSLGYGNKTNHLKPPHEYVPWVTVNNVPLRLDYPNYVKYVCKAYKGKPIKACKSRLSTSTLRETLVHPICYTKQSRNSLFFAAENLEAQWQIKPPPPPKNLEAQSSKIKPPPRPPKNLEAQLRKTKLPPPRA